MKKVLIVGGANDIGYTISKRLKELNYKIIIGYHKNIYKKLDVEYQEIDVTNEDSINNCFNKHKNIDILINLANICLDSYFLDKTKEEFMKVLETNLIGTFLLNKKYLENNNGIIINMSSTDGIDTGNLYDIDYSVSKSGIITLSRLLNNYNNKVYCLCPNYIDSDSTRSMNKEFLNQELIRIKQDRLITKEELTNVIEDIINNKYKDNILRIDIKEGKLWIEKV